MDRKYMDITLSPEKRAAELLKELSLEEKVYQLCGVWASPSGEFADKHYGYGQVATLHLRMENSMQKCADWQRKVQTKIMESSPHRIPAIFHMEGLCGAFIQDAVSFPSGIGRGASFDPELEEKVGRIVSRQERAVGITQVLAPVLDVTHDPRMGRQGESYGEDSTLGAAMGAAYTRGIQKAEDGGRCADACAKHFLGFHHSTGGIHGADMAVSERELIEKYGKPFQAAITEGNLHGVMPCYCTMNGQALSSNESLLTGLLRGEMGFDGVALSDYEAISNQHKFQGLFESLDEAGYESLKAGMDVELPSQRAYNEEFIEGFKSGKYDIKYLDQAVLRELTAKFRMGLFENPFAYTGDKLLQEFYNDSDREVTLQSARESLVLLKNDGTLPVGGGIREDGNLRLPVKKIAVIGCQADNARFFFGGYTHLSMAEATFAAASAMAGVEMEAKTVAAGHRIIPGTHIQSDEMDEMDALLKLQKPECKSLLEELRSRLPQVEIVYAYGYPIAGNDCSRHEEALKAMEGADVILFTLGGKHGSCSVSSMGEGVDGADINLPVCQDALIEKAAALGIPMVGIHMNGRPISSDIADKYLNAIIEAWNPSEMGAQAIVETLTGINNPSGKMPVTTAYHTGQLPVYYNHMAGSSWNQGDSIGFKDYVDLPHRPRYYFGQGLSYTTFDYSDLQVLTDEVSPEGTIRLSFTITNTGDMAGTEIVQIYVRDVFASMVRPVKELAGFGRIYLMPGECKTVSVEIAPSQLAFLDRDLKWKIEKGEIRLMIGSSSEDIWLEDRIVITENKWIRGAERAFYAKVTV